MDNSSGDEARKKRDSAQVEQKEEQEEKPKKVRVEAVTAAVSSSSRNSISPARRRALRDSPPPPSSNNDSPAAAAAAAAAATRPIEASSGHGGGGGGDGSNNNTSDFAYMYNNNNNNGESSACGQSRGNSDRRIWDLESALLHLVQVECQEYLADDKSSWVTFRVGHAGDASIVANWYRQSQKQNKLRDSIDNPELEKDQARPADNDEDSSTSSSSMLEVWLADGLGDEDTPPSVYCLLGNVHKAVANSSDESMSSSSTSTAATAPKSVCSLGAVAVLTLAWADSERVLRIEWMHIDPNLPSDLASTLGKKLWLRLSTLSLMTACRVLAVDEKYTQETNKDGQDDEDDEASKRLQPSAE